MSDETPTAAAKSRVQSVSKALRVLEILADCPQGELGVTDIARRLGWHRTTVYRFMQTLVEEGYVKYLPSSESYRLTFKLVGLANQLVNRLDIRQVVRPHLLELVERTQISGHLAILEESQVVFIDRIDCDKPLRTNFHIGRRGPAYATSIGKALLAETDWETVRSALRRAGTTRFTEHTIIDEEQIRQELQTIQLNGYSIDREEHSRGVACVGAAIHDITGRPVAGISLSGSASEVLANVETLGPAVRQAADRISADLGWHG